MGRGDRQRWLLELGVLRGRIQDCRKSCITMVLWMGPDNGGIHPLTCYRYISSPSLAPVTERQNLPTGTLPSGCRVLSAWGNHCECLPGGRAANTESVDQIQLGLKYMDEED